MRIVPFNSGVSKYAPFVNIHKKLYFLANQILDKDSPVKTANHQAIILDVRIMNAKCSSPKSNTNIRWEVWLSVNSVNANIKLSPVIVVERLIFKNRPSYSKDLRK